MNKTELQQTRIDIGNDGLLKDCYTEMLLPLFVAVPNVTIRQHATNKNCLHVKMPFNVQNQNVYLNFYIPVEEMRLAASFEADIDFIKKLIGHFYGTGDSALTLGELNGERKEKAQPKAIDFNTKLEVVLTAKGAYESALPEEFKDMFKDKLAKAKGRQLEDNLRAMLMCCVVESDCEYAISNADPTKRIRI